MNVQTLSIRGNGRSRFLGQKKTSLPPPSSRLAALPRPSLLNPPPPPSPLLLLGTATAAASTIPLIALPARAEEDVASIVPQDPLIGVLFFIAVVLLGAVTLGAVYLSYSQWQEERQEKEEKKNFEVELKKREYESQMQKFSKQTAKVRGSGAKAEETTTPRKKSEPSDKSKGFGS